MIDTISEVIEESKAMCRCPISGIFFDENSKSELLAGCDYQQDLIKMLEVVMLDRYSIIRDFLYKWFCQYHLTHFIRTRIMQRERYDHSRAFFGLPEEARRWRCRFFCWPNNSYNISRS